MVNTSLRITYFKQLIVIVALLSVVGSILLTLIPNPLSFNLHSSANLESLPVHEHPPFEIVPLENSQIWEFNGDLWIYGKINITPSWGTYNRIYIEGYGNVDFIDGVATIDTSRLPSGVIRLDIIQEGTPVDISYPLVIHVSRLTLFQYQILNTLTTLMNTFAFLLVSFPLNYFLLIKPNREYFSKKAFKHELLDVEVSEKEWLLLIEHAKSIIHHLSGRTDYYSAKRKLLIYVAILLLAFYFIFGAFAFSTNLDLQLRVSLLFAGLLGGGILLWPITILFSSSTPDYLPSTSWFYGGRISTDFEGKHVFDYDLRRSFYTIVGFSQKDIFMDNLTEIVSLYHILKKSKETCDTAKGGLLFSGFYFLAGFSIFFFGFLEFREFLLFGSTFILVAIFLLVFLFVHYRWFKQKTTFQMLTLYYHEQNSKESNNPGILELLRNRDQYNLTLIPINLLNEEAQKHQLQAIIDAASTDMENHNLEMWDFQKAPKKFGDEIAVLVINNIGITNRVIIFPHYRKEADMKQQVNIEEFLKQPSDYS